MLYFSLSPREPRSQTPWQDSFLYFEVTRSSATSSSWDTCPFQLIMGYSAMWTPKGLLTWRKVVHDRRTSRSPEPSFTERLINLSEKSSLSADRAKTWPSRFRGMAKKYSSQSVYMEKCWFAPQVHANFKSSHPPPRGNLICDFLCNSSQLFIKWRMKNSLARGGSVWWVNPSFR